MPLVVESKTEIASPISSPRLGIPLIGAKWAAKSEAYASLISEHLSADAVWLDAGCGSRVLEADLEPLEDWLVAGCRQFFGMDVSPTSNRHTKSVIQGSLDDMPFPDNSLDIVTCRMVVEHLDRPLECFVEVARCLRPGGVFIVSTPNLVNYGIFGNAVATKLMPEKLRLRIVHASDSRTARDIFPVRYHANTVRRLTSLLTDAGFQVHRATRLRQLKPFWPKLASLETVFMRLTPYHVLQFCAHKPATAKPATAASTKAA